MIPDRFRISTSARILIVALAWLVLFSWDAIANKYIYDHNRWFEYETIEFAGRDPDSETALLFISHRRVYRESDFVFHDTLYCRSLEPGAEYTNFDSRPDRLSGVMPDDVTEPRRLKPWRWDVGDLPPVGWICKLRAAPAVVVPGGYQHEQVIWTEPFTIPPRRAT
ncbi:hypothetical protein [Roseibium album]|uniref:hypothetical protein n=1 Tax=Roseibium album TaxID=311410 RepID=UPI003BB0F8D3